MSGERQVNVKSQSELDIGGRETCQLFNAKSHGDLAQKISMQTRLAFDRDKPRTLDYRL